MERPEDMENHHAKELLNVPVNDYEDLRLVREDQAAGSSNESFADVSLESTNVGDEASETERMSIVTQSNNTHANRSFPWEEFLIRMDGLIKQVARLTDAVVSSNQSFRDEVFINKVFNEVMSFEGVEGFDEDFLVKAFEYLTMHPLAGRQFLAKRHSTRMKWLRGFASRVD